MHGTIGLIDGGVAFGFGGGIGIGDGNSPERLASDHPRLFFLFPVRIKERGGKESITVRPAVDGDAVNIAGRIKARRPEHGCELLADIALESRKRGAHQLNASCTMLIALRQPRLAWSTKHEQHDRLFRIRRKMVVAQTDWEIEHGETVIAPGRDDLVNSEFMETGPVRNGNVGVDERSLYKVRERFPLLFREFRAKVRNHGVVTGEQAIPRPDNLQLSAPLIGDLDLFCRLCWSDVADVNNRAVEADADSRARIIKSAVVCRSRNDVVHGVAGDGCWYKRTNQHAGDRGVAVWKMENVRFCLARVL